MQKGNTYYLKQYADQQYRHGGVGYSDAEKIVAEMGFLPLQLPVAGPLVRIRRFWQAWRISQNLSAGDTVFVVYPVYGRMDQWLLKRVKQKGIKLIALVADIDGLKDEDAKMLEQDIKLLSIFDAYVVHGAAMEKWVLTCVKKAPVTQLEFFDFLAPVNTAVRVSSNQVAFAGNLYKSGFLAQLRDPSLASLHFRLYGEGVKIDWQQPGRIDWEGQFAPAELPLSLQGAFGLVWDGDSAKEATGALGRYMQYISHHKLSLYILAGMPVIVSAEAASAVLVEKYGIGLVIDSLEQLPEQIKKLSEESYSVMRKNMEPLARRISSGQNLRQALEQLLKSDH